MNFATSVIHVVSNIEDAATLLARFGFNHEESGPGYALLSNGSMAIRLVDDAAAISGTLNLDVRSTALTEDKERLVNDEGFTVLREIHFPHTHRTECTLAAPYNIHITLSRRLTEDDLGDLPSLSNTIAWDDNATLTAQQLIRMVPVDFREHARKRMVQTAEQYCAEAEAASVNLDMAVRAVIKISPKFQRKHIYSWLHAEGIEASTLMQEFPPE